MALEFNGSDTYVTLAKPSFFSSSVSALSLSIWVKANVTGIYQMPFSGFDSAGGHNNGGFYIYFYATGEIMVGLYDVPGSKWREITLDNSHDTLWHHIAIVLTGIYFDGYYDGDYKDGTTLSGNVDMSFDNDMCLGKQAQDDVAYFDGIVDDLRIYNVASSAGEIKTLYHSRGVDGIVNGLKERLRLNEKSPGETASGANSLVDESGNGNHGTPVNSPVYAESELKILRPQIVI